MKYVINQTADGVIKYPVHCHKNYEIMFYLEGDGYMHTEQGDFSFNKGTVIIVPPGIMHGSVSENGFKNISIEGEFNGFLNFDRVVSFSDTVTKDCEALATLIYNNRFGSETYLNLLSTSYVTFLLKNIDVKNQISESITSIIGEIYENAFDCEINLTKILNKHGYSEDYIRSCFTKRTGKTPHAFLTEIRINQACFLIDVYGTERSLTEIAEQCGYSDYVYFSKQFKRIVGKSPREYRS